MAAAFGLLVVGFVAVTIIYFVIKVAIALLPAALVVGLAGVLGLTFCDDTCATQSEPVKPVHTAPVQKAESHIEEIEEYVEEGEIAVESIDQQVDEKIEEIEEQVEHIRDDSRQKYHQQIRSMTRQKPSVNLEAILPEIDSAISVVVWAYCVATGDENFKPLITSANDYEGHSAQSAHYSGAAVDFRIKDMGSLAEREELVSLIREELGDRFTVLHEDIGKNNEHLHVQLRRGTYDRTIAFNK